jgi:hypothetical protein
MFEIGSSLREARLRQGLDFPEVEQGTKIRAKYLRALEDEQFDLLPAQTYVKGFLRTYAEYLGLDGQLYVDEFSSRYVVGGDEELPVRSRGSARARPAPRLQTRAVMLTLLGISLVTALVIVAWTHGGSGPQRIPGLASTGATTGRAATPTAAPRRRPRPTVARLRLAAALDASWLQVRRGGVAGPVLYEGTLQKGQRLIYVARRLWIVVGRPAALAVTLNGRTVSLPALGPRTLDITARRVRLVAGA